MDGESQVEARGPNAAPLWRRRATPGPQPPSWNRPRPRSYQSAGGLLVTDFPLEELGALPRGGGADGGADRQQGHGSPPLPSAPRGSPEPRAPSPRPRRPRASRASPPANGAVSPPPPPRTPGEDPAGAPAAGLAVPPGGAGTQDPGRGPRSPGHTPPRRCRDADSPSADSPSGSPAPDPDPDPDPPREPPAAVLSTHSPAALKLGRRQIIPRALASESRGGPGAEPHRRALKVRSLAEAPGAGAADVDADVAEREADSPGTLRRGLRSTSYRRAVVSGLDLDNPTSSKKKNRLSQPLLKAVAEDRDKFSSLGRVKKKMLKGQGTFDGEENAVLYQNYKEKALDIDSDEESEPREQKSEGKIVIHHKPLRSTWSQLSAVKTNGLSQTVSQEERKRQEAIFEVISSEHSYLLSLEILIRMFKNSKELSDTMTKTERHHLFSNISDVCEASRKFFTELEARHQNSIIIDDISDIVEKHTASTFDPYVKYCTNEVYQQRTLQRLLATNPSFKEVLSRIESHEDCRNLPMISFLILPMQRVTRLPLLMDTICQKTPKDSPKYEVCKRALKEVSKLVRLCNEGARKMERTEMMYTINSQLEFKIKPFPLVSSSRWLVKRGELTAYVEDTVLFSRRTSRQQVYFFLFNDVLIITKKKSEESYNVNDYSLREQLLVEPCDSEELNSPGKNGSTALYSRQSSASHLFTLTILSNHANEKVEMLLGAETQSERARWVTALGSGGGCGGSGGRRHLDRTALTQVEVVRSFTARQPDELSLQVADVVLTYQHVGDGWYEGERLRDGERGWFPAECAREITCRATIDRNVERMGRLLGLETHV
ncbi:rho guanine nucleotide exchange factor 26-like isoform X2 [Dipodomys merriami]|uniref:rho guanine nucleotide exchange factor 26-like isoform X2 n=1 Tax=Dipodomys merriami TaxID=94247 RepID=UPI003855DE95